MRVRSIRIEIRPDFQGSRETRQPARAAYDVIVMPRNQGRSAKGMVYDIDARAGKPPMAYTKSDQFKNLGMYGESADITGGMGLEGVVEFRKFVEAGGTLITLGTASAFPAEFGITRRVEAARTTPQFYALWSHRAGRDSTRRESHLLWIHGEDDSSALGQRSAADSAGSRPGATGPDALHRWRSWGSQLGLMRGANEIRGRPAVVDVLPEGEGRVVMFSTNPCYPWQNFGEFGMLFNAVMHYKDPEAAVGCRDERWLGNCSGLQCPAPHFRRRRLFLVPTARSRMRLRISADRGPGRATARIASGAIAASDVEPGGCEQGLRMIRAASVDRAPGSALGGRAAPAFALLKSALRKRRWGAKNWHFRIACAELTIRTRALPAVLPEL